jgi:hypothetical protein
LLIEYGLAAAAAAAVAESRPILNICFAARVDWLVQHIRKVK